MLHSDFHIGLEFVMSEARWRCTDIGKRTVIAIKLEHPDDPSWYSGPTYAVMEMVLDEHDIDACEPVDAGPEYVSGWRPPRVRACELVEAELRRLEVERVHVGPELVTLTTRQIESGHSHGEGKTLLEAFEDLERAVPRRP